jgi:anti-sigma-K factor RskA
MNLKELNQKLLAAARHNPLGDHVTYAFEKRIMAHITGRPQPDTLGYWAQALFRSALASTAIVLLLSVGTAYLPSTETTPAPTAVAELSQDLQETLLASVDASEMADLNTTPADEVDFTDPLEEIL